MSGPLEFFRACDRVRLGCRREDVASRDAVFSEHFVAADERALPVDGRIAVAAFLGTILVEWEEHRDQA